MKSITKINIVLAVLFVACISSLYLMGNGHDCNAPQDQVSALTTCNLN